MIATRVAGELTQQTELERVAALLARAYPPQAMRMDADYLAWCLGADAGTALRPRTALAERGKHLVGFAGAAPIRIRHATFAGEAYLVSFVAVDPSARGNGIAQRLYASLLADLATGSVDPVVLTHAQAESRGAELVARCYPDAGWCGVELEPLAGWGIARRRISTTAPDDALPPTVSDEVRTSPDQASIRYWSRDPRAVAVLPDGTRVLVIHTGAPRGVPIGAIDCLPSRLSAPSLHQALLAASRHLPPEVGQLMVPNLPAAGSATAAAIGLRRLPGPPWRNWLWTRRADHPLRTAGRTAVPII